MKPHKTMFLQNSFLLNLPAVPCFFVAWRKDKPDYGDKYPVAVYCSDTNDCKRRHWLEVRKFTNRLSAWYWLHEVLRKRLESDNHKHT